MRVLISILYNYWQEQTNKG